MRANRRMVCVHWRAPGFIAEVVLGESVSCLLRDFQDILDTEKREQKVGTHN
jgi:hypothetical protein